MKKLIMIILLIIAICLGIYFYQKNFSTPNVSSSNYTAEKTIGHENNTILDSSIPTPTENTKLSDFSTKLPKDTKARYSNIQLACDTLNDTIVKSGETFSLWNTLGCPTKEKGYQKAKAFTSNGKIRKSYGGGICQVSTTIYNALLEIDGIQITERHEHSRDVVYIKDGRDAAVAYRSADLKFKNNLSYDIQLKSSVKNNKVKIEIVKAYN